jgi:hypothetical protein
MKKIIFLLVAMAMVFPVFSQEKQATEQKSFDELQMKTLFGNKDHKKHITLGYFIEMNAGYTQFDTKDVFLPGMSFGMILDHNWAIGLAGSFVANTNYLYYPDIYYDIYTNTMAEARLGGGYGSLLVEYTLLPRSVVHVSFPLMIGGGYMAYYNDDLNYTSGYPYNHYDHHAVDEDGFFVIEPGVKAEFNIIKKLRIGVGVSYRYTPDLDLVNTPKDLINQFTGRLSLRFGKF